MLLTQRLLITSRPTVASWHNGGMSLPGPTLELIQHLQSRGIEPVLYGSQGVSLYLGAFKECGDVDLLVDAEWLGGKWPELSRHMHELGYALTDEHEHEFTNGQGVVAAFASKDIITRDGIAPSIAEAITTKQVDNTTFQTLTPLAFKRAYEFSQKDGYRKDVRGKNDRQIISLLAAYIAGQQQ